MLTDAAAIMIHSTAMLVTMGPVASNYEKLGLGKLQAWLNLTGVGGSGCGGRGLVVHLTSLLNVLDQRRARQRRADATDGRAARPRVR